MTEFKKKSGSITSIADEVAALHGLTKSTMRPLTKSVFTALVNQLFEKGRVAIPGIGVLNIEMSIRSGSPRAFVRFKIGKALKDREQTILVKPENLAFVNYLLQRDDTKHRRYEVTRIRELAFAAQQKALKLGHERNRVAVAIKAATGVDVDPSSIAEEHAIRPHVNTPRLPPHHIEVRDLLAVAGVFPLEKLYLPAHLRAGTPPAPPVAGSVPS